MNYKLCRRSAALAIVSVLFCSLPSVHADDDEFVGTGVEIIPEGGQDLNLEGYSVFKDSQGSYYACKGAAATCEPDYHSVKPQTGDKIKYKDNDGVEHTVTQPTETSDDAFEDLHDYKDSLLDSLPATPVGLGDVIYPLAVPSSVADELAGLDPGAFGVLPITEFSFFGISLAPTEILVVGSASSSGDTASAFALDVGTEWLDLSFDDLIGQPALKVVAGTLEPEEASNHVILVGGVPEPSTLGLSLLAACGGLWLARVRRQHLR